jgi:hypothetical protein
MFVIDLLGDSKLPVIIERVVDIDYKALTANNYSFKWGLEKENIVYKLRVKKQTGILGLMSIEYFDNEERIEIKLLEVGKENVGSGKSVERIAGNLIAYAARLAIKKYGVNAAISLIPKTLLSRHYIDVYHFEQAGRSLFIEGKSILKLLNEYDYDK